MYDFGPLGLKAMCFKQIIASWAGTNFEARCNVLKAHYCNVLQNAIAQQKLTSHMRSVFQALQIHSASHHQWTGRQWESFLYVPWQRPRSLALPGGVFRACRKQEIASLCLATSPAYWHYQSETCQLRQGNAAL